MVIVTACNIRSIIARACKCLARAGYIQLPVVHCNMPGDKKEHILIKNVTLNKNILILYW